MDSFLIALMAAGVTRGLVHLFLLFRLFREHRRPLLVIWRKVSN
jgi:hypothetical protein